MLDAGEECSEHVGFEHLAGFLDDQNFGRKSLIFSKYPWIIWREETYLEDRDKFGST